MLKPHRVARLSYPTLARGLTKIREVDTTKTKLNRENLITDLIPDDDYFGKMDPDKVRDPSTKEHKVYRLAKNLNIIKEERLTEEDFTRDPIASDIPNKVNNQVFRNLTPWGIFKNVPRFRYNFMSMIAKVWRNWDPTKDHLISNDNPVPKSLSYQLHKNAFKIPARLGNFLSFTLGDWGSKYTTKVPNYPNTLAHQNGVFLFQSYSQESYLKLSMMQFQILACVGLLFISPFKIPILILGGAVAATHALFSVPALYGVIRADFLPHTEQLLFTKSGHFGQLYPCAVNCSDLVRAEAKNLPYVPDHVAYECLDQSLVFRDNATGDYYAFPKLGVWSEEGLEHPLLNSLLK